MQHELSPDVDVKAIDKRLEATSNEPWYEIRPMDDVAGRWVRLDWSAGFYDPVCRPVLRLVSFDSARDVFLPGAPFGRANFTLYVPADTRRLMLSPTDRAGSFGFRLDGVRTLKIAHVVCSAFRQWPSVTLLALGAALIGRPRDARALLRDALAKQPVDGYVGWRDRNLREPEPSGIDGPAPELSRPLRMVWLTSDSKGEDGHVSDAIRLNSASSPEQWCEGLEAQDLVALLAPDNFLLPRAQSQLAVAANAHPETDVFYGDEEVLGGKEIRIKPGFDPYLTHTGLLPGSAAFVRVSALQTGRVKPKLKDGAICLEIKEDVGVMSLFRPLTVSAGCPSTVQMTAERLALKPSKSDLDKKGIAIILPTRDRIELLRPCVESLFAKTQRPFHLVIVDNGSTEPEALAYLNTLVQRNNVTVLRLPGPFNYSALCNAGAASSTADLLVFLNNDTEALVKDWASLVLPLALAPECGAVGAKLLFANRKVQHAGCIVGMGGRAGHFEHGTGADDPGIFGRNNIVHRVSAVTGAFLAVERKKFEAVGGFDAENLPIDLNDIDLCLRLREAGFENLMQPACLFLHHESASRGHARDSDMVYARERRYFSKRWISFLRADPYFTPILSLYDSNPSLG